MPGAMKLNSNVPVFSPRVEAMAELTLPILRAPHAPTAEPTDERRAPACVCGDTTKDPSLAPRNAPTALASAKPAPSGWNTSPDRNPSHILAEVAPGPVKLVTTRPITLPPLVVNSSAPKPSIPRALPSSADNIELIAPIPACFIRAHTSALNDVAIAPSTLGMFPFGAPIMLIPTRSPISPRTEENRTPANFDCPPKNCPREEPTASPN